MTRTIRRLLLPFLCATLLSGGTLAQLALTAEPASAATPVSSMSVASSDPASVVGESVTFTVTVTGTTVTPTGTVTVRDSGTPICSGVALAELNPTFAGAQCTTSALTVGTHPISATYSGDATYDPSDSTTFAAALSQVVSKAATSTALGSDTNPSAFNGSVVFTASVLATAPGGGTPAGTVAFKAGGTDITGCAAKALVSGSTTCTTSALAVGAPSITAVYSGNASYLTSTSSAIIQTVNQATTSTALSSDTNPSAFNGSVIFTATVSSTAGTPTGTVAFKAGGTDITGCAAKALVSGSTTCTTSALAVGTPSITAVYSGDTSFATSTSAALIQTVNPATTSTALSSGTNPSVFGGSVIFTATVTSTAGTPTGTVAFRAGGTDITGCAAKALVSGTATCTTAALAVGTPAITAVYGGASSYLTSTSAPTTQTVAKASTTTVVASSDTTTNWTDAVTFTATISPIAPATAPPSAGTVSFNIGGTAITACTAQPVTGGVATCNTTSVPIGAASITAVYSGDASYLTSTSPAIIQTVTKATTVTTLSSNHNPSRFGQSVTLNAIVTSSGGTPTGNVTFFRVRRDSSYKLLTISALVAGTATLTTTSLPVRFGSIVAQYNGATDYALSTTTFAQTVFRSFSRTTMSSSTNPSTFGRPVTFRVTVASSGVGAGTPTGAVVLYRVGVNNSRQRIGQGTLQNGVSRITISNTPIGLHKVYAQYRGSSTHRPSYRTMLQQANP